MIIRTLWATRKSEPDLAPELLTAWDEYAVDGNWEGWQEDCAARIKSMGDDLADHRYFDIVVDESVIRKQFNEVTIDGTVRAVT